MRKGQSKEESRKSGESRKQAKHDKNYMMSSMEIDKKHKKSFLNNVEHGSTLNMMSNGNYSNSRGFTPGAQENYVQQRIKSAHAAQQFDRHYRNNVVSSHVEVNYGHGQYQLDNAGSSMLLNPQ